MAAACTVLKPQTWHPRKSRTEAEQLLKSCRFGHTEEGSFVIKVSCPLNAVEYQPALIPAESDMPFVRRTTWTVHQSLNRLVSAIEMDNLDVFVNDVQKSQTPELSSNLCDAIARFYDDELSNSLEISFSWALSAHVPPPQVGLSIIRIQKDYFPRIAEVSTALRSQEKHKEDLFIGTVETLNGEIGEDGRRAGEIIVAIILKETGGTIRARLNLNADDYAKADKAHMTTGDYVRVNGKLHPGRQPRLLSDVSKFEPINS